MNEKQQEVLDKINEMMDASYGCAGSFVAAVGDYLWGAVDDSIQMISTGFSGGVGGTHEELCSGVSGATMILGLLYGRTAADEAKMIRCKRLVSAHRERFVARFGTTCCQELRDAQFGADERNPCSAIIAPAAFMLLALLEEEAAREAQEQEAVAQMPRRELLPKEEYTAVHADAAAETLVVELERRELPHDYRAWIGERMVALGDPRPGVGLTTAGLPDISWLPVAGSTVEVERSGSFTADAFYIARYPLTYMQFQPFLDDPDGFAEAAWWDGLAVGGYRR